ARGPAHPEVLEGVSRGDERETDPAKSLRSAGGGARIFPVRLAEAHGMREGYTMAEIQVGQDAPDFETVDDKGEKIKLSDFRGKKVVLYFYPKDDTPGCTRQACGFRDNYAAVEEKNAVVLGVSPDGVESHVAFRDKFELPFPLLVDEDKAISEAYSVWRERERDGQKF